MNFDEWTARCKELQFRHRHAVQALADEKEALQTAMRKEEACEEARDILQATGQVVQQQAHDRIADTVSRCLQAVFGRDYRFSIVFERKRGRTEARLVFHKKDREMDPMFSSGGGVLDVAAFALRVACLMMTKPPLRKILFLDEPFRHLNKERRPLVATLIESISRELGIQIILITHDEEFQVGKVVRVQCGE